MGLFDPAWLRLHHRICDLYEVIAFKHYSEHPDREIDVVAVVSRVLEQELKTTPQRASELASQLHTSFNRFPVRSAVEESMRSRNPSVPDEAVTEIYEMMKRDFVEAEHWHVYFLYFVISYILASGDYGSTRGDYLMRIVFDPVPENRGVFKNIKRTFCLASFRKSESSITKVPTSQWSDDELDDKMSSPAGRILTWACNLAGESEDFLKAQFPAIVKYPNRESFGNFLQIAMIVAAFLRIERYLASSNYATLHTSIIESIAPSVRHLYVPLLHELSACLLQTNLESLPKNELPSFESLLVKDEEQLSRGIAIWVIGKTKGSKPQEPDFALINAITQLACTSNAPFIASLSLSDGKSLNRIV